MGRHASGVCLVPRLFGRWDLAAAELGGLAEAGYRKGVSMGCELFRGLVRPRVRRVGDVHPLSPDPGDPDTALIHLRRGETRQTDPTIARRQRPTTRLDFAGLVHDPASRTAPTARPLKACSPSPSSPTGHHRDDRRSGFADRVLEFRDRGALLLEQLLELRSSIG